MFLDSGMISAMSAGEPSWSGRQSEIASLAKRIGVDFVSHLDVPMERRKLSIAKLGRTKALDITIRNARLFMDEDVGTAKKVYVIQGWDLSEYQRCIREFRDIGLPDGGALGIGSCCMRPENRGLWPLLQYVREETQGKFLHSFGTGDPDKLARLAALGIDSVDEGNTIRALIFGHGEDLERLTKSYRRYDA